MLNEGMTQLIYNISACGHTYLDGKVHLVSFACVRFSVNNVNTSFVITISS